VEVSTVFTTAIYEIVKGSTNDPDGVANSFVLGSKTATAPDFWMTVTDITTCPVQSCTLLNVDNFASYVTLDSTNFYLKAQTDITETILYDNINIKCKFGTNSAFSATTPDI